MAVGVGFEMTFRATLFLPLILFLSLARVIRLAPTDATITITRVPRSDASILGYNGQGGIGWLTAGIDC